MHRSSTVLDPAMLRRLYTEELRSAREIANDVGCSETTVRRRLRRFNIALRSRGPCVDRIRAGDEVVQRRWSAETAYLVGLIATDGNLGRTKPVITLVSKDLALLETARRCLPLRTTLGRHPGGHRGPYHRLSWYNRSLYQWLREIGLTPAKSLSLSPLAIPDACFVDFFRGCIDGDGSIVVYADRQHVAACDRYVYERLYLSIVSASEVFIDWLRSTVRRLTDADGSISVERRAGAHSVWKLRYSKADSIRLLRWMYYAPDVRCLDRKRAMAEKFLSPLGHAASRGPGRPRAGWIYNGGALRTSHSRTDAGVE